MKTELGTLGIMVSMNNQRKRVLKKYLSFHSIRLKLFCFTPSDIDWDRKMIKGLHLNNRKWTESTFPFPKVIYNRCYNPEKGVISQLESHIGSNRCFNQITQFEKLEVHRLLSRWLSPHLPDTFPYERETLEHLLNLHKLVYVKPRHGNMGKGVYRVERKDNGEFTVSSHHILPTAIVGDIRLLQEEMDRLIGTTPYLIQKGIYTKLFNDRSFDIRVLVQKNKSGQWTATNVVSRIAYKGCFNTSICERVCLTQNLLKRLYPQQIVRNMMNVFYNISLRSAEIIEIDSGVHLCEASVDLALDNEGHVWIIEVNGKPQKSLYDGISYKKKAVYSRPIEYGKYLHNQ
jgi:hypothetical protein